MCELCEKDGYYRRHWDAHPPLRWGPLGVGVKSMSEEFKVGDVVALRSSPIKMTVVNVHLSGAPDDCDCVWFDEQKTLHSGRFPIAALVNLSESIKSIFPLAAGE